MPDEIEISITYPYKGQEGDKQTCIVAVGAEAMDAVRLAFNPSGDTRITTLKAVAALLWQLQKNIELTNPAAGREAAVARTNLQTASMWGVLALTKGL